MHLVEHDGLYYIIGENDQVVAELNPNGTPRAKWVRLVRTSNQSIADRTLTKCIFESVKYGDASWWNVANPTRITVPYTGVYWIGGNVGWDLNGTRSRQADLYLNDTTFLAELGGGFACTTADNPTNSGNSPQPLTAGDYFEMRLYQASSAPVNATFEMWAILLGH